MTDDLELLRRHRPMTGSASAEARAAARRALDAAITGSARERSAPRRTSSWRVWLVPAFGVAVVIAVAAVFLSVHGRRPAATSGGTGRGLELVFRAEPTPQVPHVGPAEMTRVVGGVRRYLDSVLPGTRVGSAGNELLVRAPSGRTSAGLLAGLVGQAERLLFFYDWEANALTPTGRPVASLLPPRAPSAVLISQGGTNGAPGTPGAGSMSLYQAVGLAAKQPRWLSRSSSRLGPEYFMFGAPGSRACASAARYYEVVAGAARRCYLAGPQDTIGDLHRALPPGLDASSQGAQTLVVQQGWVVLQALAPSLAHEEAWSDPAAQYYVLRDRPTVLPDEVANPRPSTDADGAPDIAFDFTPRGGKAFGHLTAAIARRGQLDGASGQKLFQHFAVVLGTQLITVPFIDYTQNPLGVPPGNGAIISGNFTIGAARDLAQIMGLGALPVHLKLIHSKR